MGKLLSVLFPNDAATYSHKAQNFGAETSTTKHIISYVKAKCLRLWTYEVINGRMAILCTLSLKKKQLFLCVACMPYTTLFIFTYDLAFRYLPLKGLDCESIQLNYFSAIQFNTCCQLTKLRDKNVPLLARLHSVKALSFF